MQGCQEGDYIVGFVRKEKAIFPLDEEGLENPQVDEGQSRGLTAMTKGTITNKGRAAVGTEKKRKLW